MMGELSAASVNSNRVTQAKPSQAAAFLREAAFYWHQRFQLAPGIYTPGVNDVEQLLNRVGVLGDVRGASVLDIGATNGGLAFELERRGASRVVAVDIYDEDWFGFRAVKELLGSCAEYVCASVYELPQRFVEPFDIVALWGVLYHLRHPLLALDAVRALTRRVAMIETAVSDHMLVDSTKPLLYFHREDDLNGDGSNWFVPTTTGLADLCWSSGLEPTRIESWPEEAPARSMITVVPTGGDPEYLGISYEMPLRAVIAPGHLLPGARGLPST